MDTAGAVIFHPVEHTPLLYSLVIRQTLLLSAHSLISTELIIVPSSYKCICHQCSMAEEVCGLLLQADGQKGERATQGRKS